MSATGRITRLEVIDDRGRAIVMSFPSSEYQFQDGGQTFKVFVGYGVDQRWRTTTPPVKETK